MYRTSHKIPKIKKKPINGMNGRKDGLTLGPISNAVCLVGTIKSKELLNLLYMVSN
jgi:hypothetical protein